MAFWIGGSDEWQFRKWLIPYAHALSNIRCFETISAIQAFGNYYRYTFAIISNHCRHQTLKSKTESPVEFMKIRQHRSMPYSRNAGKHKLDQAG